MDKIRMAFSKRQWMISAVIIAFILILFTWSRMNFAGKNRIISDVKIEINNPIKDFQLLTNQEISERIQTAIGNPIGKSAADVSLTKLEQALNQNPEIQNSTVYVAFNGSLHVKITERQPIALMVNIKGDRCYLDTSMRMIPYKHNSPAPVIVLNGAINQKIVIGKKLSKKWQGKLKSLLIYIHENSFWDNLFEQCYVDKLERILLYPNIGKHSIVMNNADNVDEKLANLRLFYEKGLNHVGWNTYHTIDISYRNQIVTKPRVSNTEHN